MVYFQLAGKIIRNCTRIMYSTQLTIAINTASNLSCVGTDRWSDKYLTSPLPCLGSTDIPGSYPELITNVEVIMGPALPQLPVLCGSNTISQIMIYTETSLPQIMIYTETSLHIWSG
jgi:hypothetical protein